MKFPNANRDTVKLLRLCLDYSVDRILNIKNQIPYTMQPTKDLVRNYLRHIKAAKYPYVKTIDEYDLSKVISNRSKKEVS